MIAYSYAFDGYHEKAEEYRTKYGAVVDVIAKQYNTDGNHELAEAYRADVSNIRVC